MLIRQDDLVLTIGYLILEADQVELVVRRWHAGMCPRAWWAYDVATGFGLLQALAPLKAGAGAAGLAPARCRCRSSR